MANESKKENQFEHSYLSTFHYDEFYLPLIRSFLADFEKMELEICEAISAGQAKVAGALCHKHCGTSATYGFPALAKDFEALEIKLKSDAKGLLNCEPELSKLVHHMRQTTRAFNGE